MAKRNKKNIFGVCVRCGSGLTEDLLCSDLTCPFSECEQHERKGWAGYPFTTDWRKDNAGLHLLYVKTACRHLTLIDRQLAELGELHNLNMMDIIMSVQNGRDKLVRENAAYADAQEILEGILEFSKECDCDGH